MERLELRGDQVIDVPDEPGIYAWYYRPLYPNKETLIAALSRLLSAQPTISTKVTQRYGIKYVSEGAGRIVIGTDERVVPETIQEALERAPKYFESLLMSETFLYFCRPIYIGVAKSLRERIYSQHYVSLIDYWDELNKVHRFLKSNKDATVQLVMERLDLPHSFALEARVIGISPQDLSVCVFPTPNIPADIGPDVSSGSETATRRALERLLQLLSDPVCGRR